MRKNRTVAYFEGKISQVLNRNPDIQDIHELVITALYEPRNLEFKEFYLDIAIPNLIVEKRIYFKKILQTNPSRSPISLVA